MTMLSNIFPQYGVVMTIDMAEIMMPLHRMCMQESAIILGLLWCINICLLYTSDAADE